MPDTASTDSASQETPSPERTVLLSGASRGIGLALSDTLQSRGIKVIGLARTFDQSTPTTDLFVPYHIDLENHQATEATIHEILRAHAIDALICNAGVGRFGSLEQYSLDQIRHELQINLFSSILLTRLLITALKKKTRSNVVFVGSESALQGGRYGTIYSAAKFGLRGFAQSLRYECSNCNCHVGIVNPGMVRTHFFDKLNFEPGEDPENALEASDVAQAVWHMLSSPDHAVIDEINLNPLKKVVKKKLSKKAN